MTNTRKPPPSCPAGPDAGFTLTEVLIVIGIIGILIGLLFPALEASRRSARETVCMNNLKQFGIGVKLYQTDFRDEYPMWLSQMRQSYLQAGPDLWACPLDSSHGKQGGRPDWIIHDRQYSEANDLPLSSFTPLDLAYCSATSCVPRRTAEGTPNYRDEEVKACSYLYEFTGEKCTWLTSQYGTAMPGDPWRVAKMYEVEQAFIDGVRIGSLVPVVRCFFHIPVQKDGNLHDPYKTTGSGVNTQTVVDDPHPDPNNRNVFNLRVTFNVNKSWPTSWWK